MDLTGQTTVGHCAAIIENADVYLGMDSGLTHLANALHKPVVALFGPIDAKLRVVGQETCTVLSGNEFAQCQPCNDNRRDGCGGRPRCLEAIPIEAVVEAVGRWV